MVRMLSVNTLIFSIIAACYGVFFLENAVWSAQTCRDVKPIAQVYRVFLNKIKLRHIPEEDREVLLAFTLSQIKAKAEVIKKNEDETIEVLTCKDRSFLERYRKLKYAKQNQKNKVVLEIMGSSIATSFRGLHQSDIQFYTLPTRKNEKLKPQGMMKKTEIRLFGFSDEIRALTEEKNIYSAYLNVGLGMYHFRMGKNLKDASEYFKASEIEFGKIITNIKTILDNSTKLASEMESGSTQLSNLQDEMSKMERTKVMMEDYKKQACIYRKETDKRYRQAIEERGGSTTSTQPESDAMGNGCELRGSEHNPE